jgi:hypothetical protein
LRQPLLPPPAHLPHWPYNLFAMVHGGSRRAVREQQAALLQLLGPACRRHALLFSTRILKNPACAYKPGLSR